MKRIVLLSGFFVFILLSAVAYAHPPSDIKITFDSETKMLNALIIHDVSNPSKHYIKEVDVFLNGKEIIRQSISQQDNFDSQRVSFFIPDAKINDVFSVEAYCSISGKLEKQLK
jgi:desulfoferrodoxin (superoxide reductase-like protein)